MLVWGWQRAVLLFGAGALSVLAMPPFGFFPILFLTLPVLFWCLDASISSGKLIPRLFGNSFWAGWFFGFGYFLVGLYWIGSALLVEAEDFAWALPLAIVGLPAFLAIFWGLAASFARMLWPGGWQSLLSFVAVFSMAEWLRGHVLTGFPWNSIGYALTGQIQFAQNASLIGIYGLGFIILFCATAPALIWLEGGAARRSGIKLAISGLLLLIASFAFGAVRLSVTQVQLRDDMRVRIVQPAIPQREKWLPENREAIFDKLLDLSDRKTSPTTIGIESATHLIWPESTIPFILAEDPTALARIAQLLPQGTTLLVGAARAQFDAANDFAVRDVYNSILAINDLGEIIQSYDKTHLTPFGEYLPLQSILNAIGLKSLVGEKGGFAKGKSHRRFKTIGTPAFLPLICYEAIFGGNVRSRSTTPDQSVEWILNLTNDSWFDGTVGLAQHAHHAGIRAIEEGLPMVRAANTGISFITDPLGRMSSYSQEGVASVLDGQIHYALKPPPYARFGDWPFLVLSLLIVTSIAIGNLVRRGKSH